MQVQSKFEKKVDLIFVNFLIFYPYELYKSSGIPIRFEL